jgi:predicted secreted protein
MKNIRLAISVILLTWVMSLNLLAGDFAEMKFIGFSEDGIYLAFEQFGDWDDHGGGSYATTYFVDVAKNSFAIAPVVFEYSFNMEQHTGEFSEEARMARYKASVADAIKRFKIIPGNTGKLVAAHMISDHSFEKPMPKEAQFLEKNKTWVTKTVPSYYGKSLSPNYDKNRIIFNPTYYPVNPNDEDFYELKLKMIPADKPCEARGNPVKATMIEVTLKDNTHNTNLPLQILQKDKTLPAARECPFLYQIEQVYFYKDSLAVFINVYTMGFPGSTMRYMVVTGDLVYESKK